MEKSGGTLGKNIPSQKSVKAFIVVMNCITWLLGLMIESLASFFDIACCKIKPLIFELYNGSYGNKNDTDVIQLIDESSAQETELQPSKLRKIWIVFEIILLGMAYCFCYIGLTGLKMLIFEVSTNFCSFSLRKA